MCQLCGAVVLLTLLGAPGPPVLPAPEPRELPGLHYFRPVITPDELAEERAPRAVESPEDPERYVGVRHARLFAALGLSVNERGLAQSGVRYSLDRQQQTGKLTLASIMIGVHVSRKDAVRYFDKACREHPTWPKEHGTAIGSFYALWSGEGAVSGGAVRLLEENILIVFAWSGQVEEAKRTAQAIVDLIRSDREIAPRGRFNPEPRLVRQTVAPLPRKREYRGTSFRIRPEFEGLGPLEGIQVNYYSQGRPYSGSLSVMLSGNGEIEAFQHDDLRGSPLYLRAANEDNVFIVSELNVPAIEE